MGDQIGRSVEYYYCLKHQTVEGEDGCRSADRLGPFPDPATAARALEIIKDREERKSEEDDRWRDS